jgi:hypothetical protein
MLKEIFSGPTLLTWEMELQLSEHKHVMWKHPFCVERLSEDIIGTKNIMALQNFKIVQVIFLYKTKLFSDGREIFLQPHFQ